MFGFRIRFLSELQNWLDNFVRQFRYNKNNGLLLLVPPLLVGLDKIGGILKQLRLDHYSEQVHWSLVVISAIVIFKVMYNTFKKSIAPQPAMID